MPKIEISTSSHSQLLDITSLLDKAIPAGFSGVCHVFSTHTTAGLTVNENSDPDVASDIICKLEKVFPWTDSIYRHGEGNSAAHIKASLMGFSLALPVDSGRLSLGTWQAVYLCEFDGPRRRTIDVRFSACVGK